jgi:hypothetical protein
MGWTTDLLTGVAEHLAAHDIGVWRPTGGTYQPSETAIVIRAIPPAPDRLITIAPYVAVSDVGLSGFTQGIQFRFRATQDPRDCDDLADDVFDLLDSAEHLLLGGIHVNQLYRQNSTSLGQDGSKRWEASHNYYAEAERPTVHRSN